MLKRSSSCGLGADAPRSARAEGRPRMLASSEAGLVPVEAAHHVVDGRLPP
jgi:hypothetical protein